MRVSSAEPAPLYVGARAARRGGCGGPGARRGLTRGQYLALFASGFVIVEDSMNLTVEKLAEYIGAEGVSRLWLGPASRG